MSELWLSSNQYCPACGTFSLKSCSHNLPVADFFCGSCEEQYELKSQCRKIARVVADDAYSTMLAGITSNSAPNFFSLAYTRDLSVIQLQLAPKHFLLPVAIQRRSPLGPHARRAGWEGCNIIMDAIAPSGRIALVEEAQARPKSEVVHAWRSTIFRRDKTDLRARSWLLSVMRSVDTYGGRAFSLKEIYAFEGSLAERFPSNRNVKAKIRQQLQILRDQGYLELLGGGCYQRL